MSVVKKPTIIGIVRGYGAIPNPDSGQLLVLVTAKWQTT